MATLHPLPEDYEVQERNQRAPAPPRGKNRAKPRRGHRDPPAYRSDNDAPPQWDYRDLPRMDDARDHLQRGHRVSAEMNDAVAPGQRDQRVPQQEGVDGARGGEARPGAVAEIEQPMRRSLRGPFPAEDDPAYLCTDEYPFTVEQFDAKEESALVAVAPDQLALKQELPTMAKTTSPSSSSKEETENLLGLAPHVVSELEEFDLECAGKHMKAIEDKVATHDKLEGFVLRHGERAVNALNLAGVEDAPGVFADVTQRCRVVFTTKKRLIFTQAKHSAEVSVPQTSCYAWMLVCFQDQWSRRKWTSYYATIEASQILQVFVQQTLTTSYHTSKFAFNDVLGALFCTAGGTMYSEKDVDGATQTLGDHDPGQAMRRWDHTRFMRHALVIRYLDCASNSVRQTVAMAHPSTPTYKLYEMARAIEDNITLTTTAWLASNKSPTALSAIPFTNQPPSPPLYKRTAYQRLMFVLFVVSLLTFAVSPGSAILMLTAVVVSVLGSYSSVNRGSAARGELGGLSKTMLGAQGGAGLLYLFFLTRSATAFQTNFGYA
ncbi:unnamed protein product [Scytosiphon promiscuus]